MKFAAAVVIYNVSCKDSATCCALQALNDNNISVLIYDNSVRDLGNRAYCEEQGWTYLGGEGNKGLSVAYNRCVDAIIGQIDNGWICLFDDDTHIDADYFHLLREARMKTMNKILVPFIYSNGKLLSPCILKRNHRAKLFSSEAEVIRYDGERISAINSCMALDLSLFDNFRYDENIFLDGIDHNFLMHMKQKGENITVFPYRCNHDFSGDTKPVKKAALMRFSIYAKDYRYIMRKNLLGYLTLLGRRTLHLTLQYRSLSFIKVFLQNTFKMQGTS